MDNSAFMENLRQLFADCDVDNNGCLGRDEFSKLCAKIGLNKEAAEETFHRLDVDKDDKITFDEFAAGFNQYRSSASSSPTSPQQQQNSSPSPSSPSPSSNTSNQQSLASTRKPSSPASTLSRKNASPIGVMSLGTTSPTTTPATTTTAASKNSSSSSGNLLGLGKTNSGGSTDVSDFNGAAGGSSSFDTAASSSFYAPSSSCGGGGGGNNSSGEQHEKRNDNNNLDEIVYSSETTGFQDYYDHQQPTNSGQFGSLFGAASTSNNGSGSFSQVRNMQELLDCVQKLQSENQILTQIFFKDKREREEYISQLGEEFDLQVREVEERANRRAREELENEKKRLREMMQTERETLQHHYKTIEKMSKIIQGGGSVSGGSTGGGLMVQNSRSANDLLLAGEGIDKVTSKLEDTYLENRQLKRSLNDTKTDVAMIWKEMEKLKRQYEDKLSSAYQKNNETRSECDHIKQQLNLMKDSNRKLQDASDVITTYITDKVDPVIQRTAGDNTADNNLLKSPNGCQLGGSQTNSRRGSVLSEYLNSHPDSTTEDDADGDDDDDDNHHPTMSSSKVRNYKFRTKAHPLDNSNFDARSNTTSSMSSSGSGALPRINLPTRDDINNDSDNKDGARKENKIKKSSSLNPLSTTTTSTATTATTTTTTQVSNINTKEKNINNCTKQEDEKVHSLEVPKSLSGHRGNSLKNLGRHFFLGSREKLSSTDGVSKVDAAASAAKQAPKSMSLDLSDALGEPIVEPADGPSVATYNIILVGDSFVGKSSFAARFMEGNFVQGLISNCSIDFKTKAYKVDGINYTVNLWDTAGQERFRSITASYFRKADGIILMYDVTDKRSYLNVRNWMSTISDTAAENVAVLLVGNKIDLREEKNKDKCVPKSEGFRLAKEYDIVFLETSVKTGANLVPSMGRLIRLIAKNNSPEEKDEDTIRLNDKNRSFHCMPKNC